jgi:hypothetical protein
MFSTTVRVVQTLTAPKLTILINTFLIIKANEMHNFSNLFDKVLYMFRTGPLSIIRNILILHTRNR